MEYFIFSGIGGQIDLERSIETNKENSLQIDESFSSTFTGLNKSKKDKIKTSTLKNNYSRHNSVGYRECYLKTRPDFEGLGIHISCDPKTEKSPYIFRVEQNSPGMHAGLQKNDIIIEINGEEAIYMDFKYAIHLLRDKMTSNNLIIKVGDKKAYKKWVRNNLKKQN